jgi:hypothetical protein
METWLLQLFLLLQAAHHLTREKDVFAAPGAGFCRSMTGDLSSSKSSQDAQKTVSEKRLTIGKRHDGVFS